MYPNHPTTDREKPVTWRDLALLQERHARDRAAMLGYLQRLVEMIDEGLLYHQKPFTFIGTGINAGAVIPISNGDPARLRFTEITVSASSSCTGYFELLGERVTNFMQITPTQGAGVSVGDIRNNTSQAPLGSYTIVIPSGATLQFVVTAASNITLAICGNLEYKPQSGTELYRGRGF